MTAADPPDGDRLVALLGLDASDPLVQATLTRLARGMQPELDPEDEEPLIDWVTVNEIGLEFGFEDEAYVRALPLDLRGEGPILLSQLYFYGDSPKTQPFPYPLPWGLSFTDDRPAVRKKLAAFESSRRSYKRDAWRLPKFDVTVAYGPRTDRLESVFCHVPYAPWPPVPGEEDLVAPFTPEAWAALFGMRWSNPNLRARLAPLGYEAALPEVRSEKVADFAFTHGLELEFAPAKHLKAAEKRYPNSLAFAGVTFYASRELDARQWAGPLPMGISFSDTQADLRTKLGAKPARVDDEDLSGVAVWQFETFTVSVLYSNLENRVLRVSLLAPGYWEALNAPDDDE